MPHNETYKGFDIVIEDDATTPEGQPLAFRAAGIEAPVKRLRIAGRRIDVLVDESGKYSSSYLPYTTYDSVVELAKAVIEHTADFDTHSGV